MNGLPLSPNSAPVSVASKSRVVLVGVGSSLKVSGGCDVKCFEEDARALTMPKSWARAVEGWERGAVAVVGGRNVGKSTLVTAAVLQGGGKIMDLDPGRPIDGIEGTISFKGRRFFFGGAAVKDDPRRWLEGVEKLKGLVEVRRHKERTRVRTHLRILSLSLSRSLLYNPSFAARPRCRRRTAASYSSRSLRS